MNKLLENSKQTPLQPSGTDEPAGYALLDESLRLTYLSPAFAALVPEAKLGDPVELSLTIFHGMNDLVAAVCDGEAPIWHVRGVAMPPRGKAARFLDVTVLPHPSQTGAILVVRDVTAEIMSVQRLMQERNESLLQLSGPEQHPVERQPSEPESGQLAVDLRRVLDTSTLLEACAQLNLMFLLTNAALTIEDATPPFETYLKRPLANQALLTALPALAGVEDELARIALSESGPWHLPGLQISPDTAGLCDLLFMPRTDAPGLIVAARHMDAEAAVEQALRQQRNELTLLQEQLVAQSAALRAANDRLENLDRERRTLMTIIVRDIRSSLSVVSGYSEWLKNELHTEADPKRDDSLDAIMQGVGRMMGLVDDVQAMDRIEQRLSNMQCTSVSLQTLVASVASMWRGIAEMRGVRLHAEMKDNPIIIDGDTALLEEALKTLVEGFIDNAESGSTIVLNVFPWDRWGIIRLEVRPARRRDTTRLRAEPGSHVGMLDLALARVIVEGHGGHLSVQEDEEQPYQVSLWLLIKGSRKPALYEQAGKATSVAVLPQAETARTLEAPPSPDLIVAGQGSIRVNTGSRRVWVHDSPMSLTSNEYKLLLYLAKHLDMVVTHEELVQAIWGDDEEAITVENLRVLVWRLRKKLEHPTGEQYLRTVRGFGYMLAS